jgi:excisionase family DNA binding protein
VSAGGEAGDARVQKIEVIMSNERQLAEVRFLTVAEVASIMRVSKMTVYRMVHAGELPAIRVGRSFRVPEDAVHKYLRSSYVDTALLCAEPTALAGRDPWSRPAFASVPLLHGSPGLGVPRTGR